MIRKSMTFPMKVSSIKTFFSIFLIFSSKTTFIHLTFGLVPTSTHSNPQPLFEAYVEDPHSASFNEIKAAFKVLNILLTLFL
jgi:hypothetical protein